MPHYDRLSTLIGRFALKVIVATPEQANLLIFKSNNGGQLTRVTLSPTTFVHFARDNIDEEPVFHAKVEWGGRSNPLLTALPSQISLDVNDSSDTSNLVHLLVSESNLLRCGSGAVLDRLAEVLIVRLLRKQLEQGSSDPGLLGGLSDSRLSKALVAIHDRPETQWCNEDLANIAGLSMSRFYELFKTVVGITPIAYLRRWRMILARQDIEKGDRIQVVAKRYCYGSTEALNRSFTREFGYNPMHHRKLQLKNRA